MDGTGIIADATGVYAAVADDPARARALPGRAYADPAVFDAEVERVFKAGWLPVAREGQLVEPGSYICVDPVGVPLVLTLDDGGDTHLLSRICRHRGMSVVEGAGEARAFMCPYHLWRYGLDGALLSAAAMDGSQVFDPAACGLTRIRHESWGGWIFANLDGRAPALAPQLESLEARLANIRPADFVTAGVITFESAWNWKVMVENFMESYHHIGPHAGTLQQTNPGLGTYAGEGGRAFSILENPPDGPDHDPFVVAAVFPVTLMFFSEGQVPAGVWYELTDVRHDRFRLNIHLMSTPDLALSSEFVKGFRETATAIHLEDIAVCEGIQRGVTSPIYEPGPLSPLEGCLWRFHRHLQACFA